MDIKIVLDKSDYIKQRQYFIKTYGVPTLSDAVDNLGEHLAQIVSEECDEELEEYFGLRPPLKGAGDELWVSPSDLLIGKVVLKPPLTSKHIQALTHQGILEIGRDIEIKYWNEIELEKEQALAEQRKCLHEEFAAILISEIRAAELRECIACHRKLDLLTTEFEAALIEELLKLEIKLRQEFEEYSRNQEERLRVEWERRLKQEAQKTVQKMTIEFLKELERQEAIMTSTLKLEMQKRDIQNQYDICLERTRCKESIKQLKHNLECKNIANMMYLLCLERRKCCDEKANIETYYSRELEKLRSIIDQQDKQINKLREEKNLKIRELHLREICLSEILKQFQKFINFALRAAPTQAEFLLSVEKMMVFELADTVLKTNFTNLLPCEKILPWLAPQAGPSGSAGLEIKDHHDCFNEITPPRLKGAELGPEDYLPAFQYKDKLYVREDFRNMVSQGIEISPSNELWSTDVEILINTLKKSVSNVEVKKSDSTTSQDQRSRHSKNSKQSSIYFAQKQCYEEHEAGKRVSVEPTNDLSSSIRSPRRSAFDRKPSIKRNIDALQAIDYGKIGEAENHPTLMAATNSLELIRECKRKTEKSECDVEHVNDEEEEVADPVIENDSYIRKSIQSFRLTKHTDADEQDATSTVVPVKEPEDKSIKLSVSSKRSAKDSLVLNTRDSIILRKSSLLKKSAEFSITPKDSIEVQKDGKCELGRRPSKLTSAKNSLQILRESKMKLREPIPCPRRESSKTKSIKSIQSIMAKEICCERCMKLKDSSEVLDVITRGSKQSSGSKQSKDSLSKALRLSHVEVIKVEDEDKQPSVAFSATPVVYDAGTPVLPNSVSKIYKYSEKRKAKKPSKDKFVRQRQMVKILGETSAKEHIQTTAEFTTDRIHSFISLIKDHPNLIRTFTACTR